jgi:hypothetical protein
MGLGEVGREMGISECILICKTIYWYGVYTFRLHIYMSSIVHLSTSSHSISANESITLYSVLGPAIHKKEIRFMYSTRID